LRKLVYLLPAALLVLHHDFWYWDDKTLVFGFMPIGLFYHALYSIAASAAWAAVIRFAWPAHLEAFARGEDSPPS
jgi:hypothetical protein